MIKVPEQLSLCGEVTPLALVGITDLFEREDILLHAQIANQVDRAKAAFSKQLLNLIAFPYNASNRESRLHLLHCKTSV
jgi:hypothetical protein